MADACNLSQVMTKPTRISNTAVGAKKSSCIDHIFTNLLKHCSQADSVAVGCSDHNLIALTRKHKIPKSGVMIVNRRSWRRSDAVSFMNDVSNVQWSDMSQENDANTALNIFMDKLMRLVDKHAPLRKRSVKNSSAPWIDEELRALMLERDKVKAVAQNSGHTADRICYCKLRNKVTKLNHIKKKIYFKERIHTSSNDTKKLWKTLNDIMCRKARQSQKYVESDSHFITNQLR